MGKFVFNIKWWKFKEILSLIWFQISKSLNRIKLFFEDKIKFIKTDKSIFWWLIKKIIFFFIITITILYFEEFILNVLRNIEYFKTHDIFSYNGEVYSNFLISCVSVSGFLLALFYANLSGVFSAKYANLSGNLSTSILDEYVNKKYLNSIINYVLLILSLLFINIIGIKTSYFVATLTIFSTLRIIFIFFQISRRVFVFSNLSFISAENINKIENYIECVTVNGYKYRDINFQNHYLKLSENVFNVQNELCNSLINNRDYNSISKTLDRHLILLKYYSDRKYKIPFDSYWFHKEYFQKSWFEADDSEIIRALNTGTSLFPSQKANSFFLEEEINNINNKMLDFLLKTGKYDLVCNYLYNYNEFIKEMVKSGDIEYWNNQNLKIIDIINSHIDFNSKLDDNYIDGIFDLESLLFINISLGYNNYLEKSYQLIEGNVANKNNYKKLLNLNNKLVNNKRITKLIDLINIEKKIEHKVITSSEFIKENMFHYLNNELIDNTKIIDNNLLEFEKIINILGAQKQHEQAVIYISRSLELCKKDEMLYETVKKVKSVIQKYKNYDNYEWDDFDVNNSIKNLKEYQIKFIEFYLKMAIDLFATNYEYSNKKIDAYGEAYYNTVLSLIELVINKDYNNFKRIYDYFLPFCLMIDTIIKKRIPLNKFNAGYAINKYLISIIDYMNIAGFTIYFSHLYNEPLFEEIIKNDFETKVLGIDNSKEMLNMFVNYAKTDNTKLSIDVLNTSFKQKIENYIRNDKNIKYKQVGMFGSHVIIDSDDNLIKAFPFDKDLMGFSCEFYEIFLELYVNPNLDQANKFKTKFNWSEKDGGNDEY